MKKKIPPYIRIAPDGGLMVEATDWEESWEHRKQVTETERLRETIQSRRR